MLAGWPAMRARSRAHCSRVEHLGGMSISGFIDGLRRETPTSQVRAAGYPGNCGSAGAGQQHPRPDRCRGPAWFLDALRTCILSSAAPRARSARAVSRGSARSAARTSKGIRKLTCGALRLARTPQETCTSSKPLAGMNEHRGSDRHTRQKMRRG
jgi:hypothetical protein